MWIFASFLKARLKLSDASIEKGVEPVTHFSFPNAIDRFFSQAVLQKLRHGERIEGMFAFDNIQFLMP